MQTFTVKLYQAPSQADYIGRIGSDGKPMPPPKPQELKSVSVQGRNIDAARKAARVKIADNQGHKIRSLSCGVDGHLRCVVVHPADVAARKPPGM